MKKKLILGVATIAIIGLSIAGCKKTQPKNETTFTKDGIALNRNTGDIEEVENLLPNSDYWNYLENTQAFQDLDANFDAPIMDSARIISFENFDTKTVVVPFPDYVDNNTGYIYKRTLISVIDLNADTSRTSIFEVRFTENELERIGELNPTDSALVNLNFKLMSTSGVIWYEANMVNGVLGSVTVTNTSDPTFDQVLTGGPCGWFCCMGGFFQSDAGTAVQILGVAGGVGCLPCGIAGAAITGVAALGCLPAINH